RKRQKVNPYFLPVQSAKKVRQSPPFFGEKATQHQGWADFCAAKSHLASPDQPSAYVSKSSGCFLTLTKL
ncbi:MAG: hypothetical protein LBB51_03440, partial [Zoogloeaceae bacterium]|nr:hypothetical protein [Zoogloeaceae bacterium]